MCETKKNMNSDNCMVYTRVCSRDRATVMLWLAQDHQLALTELRNRKFI